MIRSGGVVLLALASAATAQMPMQQMPPDTSFASVAANEIHAVVGFRPPEFTLSLRQEETHLIFYGREQGKYDGVRCERQAAFEFVHLANLMGNVQAAVCTSEAKRVRGLAVTAPRGLELILSRMPPLDAQKRREAGLTTTRAEGPNRTEELAFPVVLAGHGLIVVQSVMILTANGRQAVVVQADSQKLCDPLGPPPSTPLCADPRQALLDIARRLERRATRQSPFRRSRWRDRRGRSGP